MVAPWRDNRWKEWLPWLLAANVYRSCFDYPMSYSKPESFFEFCRVCSALVGVKQYHKPTMTGNGKFLTPIKKSWNWGTVYGIVLPTVPKKEIMASCIQRLRWVSQEQGITAHLVGSLLCRCGPGGIGTRFKGVVFIMGWWLKMVLILNYSPVNCYITMENHHVSQVNHQ